MANKLPWFKWFADDWLSDEKLRACSFAARGFWADLLSLMHKNDRRGFLQIGGKAVTPEQLARMTGCSPDDAAHLLAELFNAGVTSVDDKGIIFSRRMTRDERKRKLCSKAGKSGGGNPLLTFKGVSKGGLKGASDSDISLNRDSSSSEGKRGEGGKGSADGFVEFWAAYPRKQGKDSAHKAWMNLGPDAELQAKIIAAVQAQKQSGDWQKGYVMNPSKWLTEKRWEDEAFEGGGGSQSRAAEINGKLADMQKARTQ